MGLVTEKWSIAFRPAQGYTDTKTPYMKAPGNVGGWYADPFLFENGGRLYLFAEFFSYRTRKGCIAVAEFDRGANRFGHWTEIIHEPFHMSYPLVFADGDGIYMLPETAEAGQLLLYKAVQFPYGWERYRVICDGVSYVDTTPLPQSTDAIAYELANGAPQRCLVISLDGSHAPTDISDRRALNVSRPGGLCVGDIMVAQDCRETYGGGLKFFNKQFEEIFSIAPKDIAVFGERGAICGVHTYNTAGGIEVIDYKTMTVSPVRIAHRLVSKVNGK
ncbi:MAG: hypothetical protein IJ766_09900 [Clostridia bacterium]|nr:hypothetical protein [Clostridia bacterium]